MADNYFFNVAMAARARGQTALKPVERLTALRYKAIAGK